MRQALRSFRRLMLGLLAFALVSAPLPVADPLPVASHGTAPATMAGGHHHATVTAVDAGRAAATSEAACAGDDGADPDAACCLGAACALMHGWLPAPEGLLLHWQLPPATLPPLLAEPEGVAPDPIRRPPRRSV